MKVRKGGAMKKCKHLLTGLIILLTCTVGIAAHTMSVKDAIDKKLIRLNARASCNDSLLCNGFFGMCLNLEISNLCINPLTLMLETGRLFVSGTAGIPDIIITRTFVCRVGGKESLERNAYAMSTGPSVDHASNTVFGISEMAKGELLKAAQLAESSDCQDEEGMKSLWLALDTNTMNDTKRESYIDGVIRWDMMSSGNVTIVVHDESGNEVATLINDVHYGAGEYYYDFRITGFYLRRGMNYHVLLFINCKAQAELECTAW